MAEYIFSADGRFFELYHVKKEVAEQSIFGIPYIFHDESDNRRTQAINCPGNWRIKERMCHSGDYDAVDKTGELRSLKEFGSFYKTFPEPLRFSSWAEYDHAQEKKRMEKLEEENGKLLQKIKKMTEALEEIALINNKGGPGSRRLVRELVDSSLR
ncbi:MAG: hypothetical protein Athens071425_597 [Parcubacteria group bacterium Athens0714_25]|nr:MAG: hypothetical protein Athens071425_597 [Parcubacteria group bacterium Athens0714_25]